MDKIKLLEKFIDIKEIKDLIDEIIELRFYYTSNDFEEMEKHIHKLMIKYFEETRLWNSINTEQPKTFEQAYINAENFLMFKSAYIIVKNMDDYWQRLTTDERRIFELIL